jgi:hypothetical protein
MNFRTLIALIGAPLVLVPAAESRAATPCCGIVNIGTAGVVTARETATGRTFEFQVADRRLLATLKIGQSVYADFTTMQVSVQPDGVAPCCGIVSASPAVTAPPTGRGTAAAPCCGVVANPALRRLGRVVVAYPEKVSARIDVSRAGETQSVAGGYGDAGFDLFPGTYDVTISGKLVAGVTVQSGHDTQIKVGVLRVTASEGTRVDLVDRADGKGLIGGYGTDAYGLPIGEVGVQIAGQTETVVIEAGQVSEF